MANIFDNIFKKRENGSQAGQVMPSPITENSKIEKPDSSISVKPSQFIVGCGQSVGMKRDHNEDALFCLTSVISDGTIQSPFGLFIIADGMGGQKDGEVASDVTVRTVAKQVIEEIFVPSLFLPHETKVDNFQDVLNDTVNQAQKYVQQYALGGGTTLTFAMIIGEVVNLVHIGDSRAYFIHADGSIHKITKDQSLVQRMVDLQQITEEEAAVHPQRNVLLQAVGQPEPIRADILKLTIQSNGKLLLCSDGLWGVVPEEELLKILSVSNNPVEACSKLVEAANIAGGPDNISVILVDFRGF